MPPRRALSTQNSSEPPLFEFCVRGPALSAQTRSRRRLGVWQAGVAKEAKRVAIGKPMILGRIEVRITEFGDAPRKDRDNTAKPILDAMQGVLFENDRQVILLASEWCDINGRYKVRFMSADLAVAFSAGHEFVWIRIFTHHPSHETTA